MKKMIRLAAAVLALLLLCGCSGNQYRYLEKDGLSCIKLSGSSNSASNGSSEMVELPSLRFHSFEEMRDDVVTGNFTEEEMNNLQRMTAGGLFQLPVNVSSPPVPVFPESWNLELQFIGLSKPSMHVKYAQNEPPLEVQYYYQPNDGYIESFKETSLGKPGNYVLSDANKTLYIDENYNNGKLSTLKVAVDINGFEFRVYFYNLESNRRPTDEELLQIDIQYLDLKS